MPKLSHPQNKKAPPPKQYFTDSNILKFITSHFDLSEILTDGNVDHEHNKFIENFTQLFNKYFPLSLVRPK